MSIENIQDIPAFIREQFSRLAGIDVIDVTARAYPEETNYITLVRDADLAKAAEVGNELDALISTDDHPAFVVVRKAPRELADDSEGPGLEDGVHDPRATDLIRLITSRSRVSRVQPSLSYIRDVRSSISAVTAGRHHLIFGRRGAGKTAMLVEAQRQVESEGALSCWVNIQTYRNESPDRVFLYVVDEMLNVVTAHQQALRPQSPVSVMGVRLYDELQLLLNERTTTQEDAENIIPRVARLMRRFLEQNSARLFVFLDDFYYLPRADQPRVLDMLNGCIRDCEAWLKIASIRHLTRWFQTAPPLGLQTLQDADLINLDVTLQDPKRAKEFLESILQRYASHVGIPRLSRLFHGNALDRLVLASGAVPRDYLVLAGDTIAKAQQRAGSKLVGAQEVNRAAGDAAHLKIQELEDDMASNIGSAARTVQALSLVRSFCVEETSYTYFLVDFQDKEERPETYSILADLLDVRLVHVINESVSSAHEAGRRSEAFMLDLSQFSGSRFKHGIHVLDFQSGRIVSRRTRQSPTKARVGKTPLQVISILRNAPRLELAALAELV